MRWRELKSVKRIVCEGQVYLYYLYYYNLKAEAEKKFFNSSKAFHIKFPLPRKFYYIVISLFMYILFSLYSLQEFFFFNIYLFIKFSLFSFLNPFSLSLHQSHCLNLDSSSDVPFFWTSPLNPTHVTHRATPLKLNPSDLFSRFL